MHHLKPFPAFLNDPRLGGERAVAGPGRGLTERLAAQWKGKRLYATDDPPAPAEALAAGRGRRCDAVCLGGALAAGNLPAESLDFV